MLIIKEIKNALHYFKTYCEYNGELDELYYPYKKSKEYRKNYEILQQAINELKKENEELKKRIDWFKEEHNHVKSYCESPSVEDVLHSMP